MLQVQHGSNLGGRVSCDSFQLHEGSIWAAPRAGRFNYVTDMHVQRYKPTDIFEINKNACKPSSTAGNQLHRTIFNVSFILAVKTEMPLQGASLYRSRMFFLKLLFTLSGSLIVAAESGERESKERRVNLTE